MIKKIILLFLFSALLQQANAQGPPENEHAPVTHASAKIVAQYRHELGGQSPLYQGRVYTGFDSRITGHSFFLSDQWAQGSILYDEVLYENVPMRFDIVKNELMVLHPNGYASIKLLHDRVSWFSFLNHTFIRLEQGATEEADLPETGFYDLLHNGELQVLARRKKNLESHTNQKELIRRFKVYDRFYIKKDGIYHSVGSKRAVFRLLKDRKKELRRFSRQQDFKYKENRGQALSRMAHYYETLDK